MTERDSQHPIDAVITWVDGSDPAHAQRLGRYLESLGRVRPAAADPTRFNDAGEIDWCLASIARFAPWFRHVHLVVDRQRPRLLDAIAGSEFGKRIRVVEHADLFEGFESYLPTFNSRAIITALWRIPDLAERFVYFNDDFALIQPVSPTDFFRDDKLVVRGKWRRQVAHDPLRRAVVALRRWLGRDPERSAAARVRNFAAQEYSARLAGFDQRYLRVFHNPFAMRRSTLAHFFADHPDLLEANLRHRLRSGDQFKTEVLAAHLEIAQGSAEIDSRLQTVQLKPSEQSLLRVRRKLAAADTNPDIAFACVQSLELAPEYARDRIIAWLEQRVGRIAEASTAEAR